MTLPNAILTGTFTPEELAGAEILLGEGATQAEELRRLGFKMSHPANWRDYCRWTARYGGIDALLGLLEAVRRSGPGDTKQYLSNVIYGNRDIRPILEALRAQAKGRLIPGPWRQAG